MFQLIFTIIYFLLVNGVFIALGITASMIFKVKNAKLNKIKYLFLIFIFLSCCLFIKDLTSKKNQKLKQVILTPKIKFNKNFLL